MAMDDHSHKDLVETDRMIDSGPFYRLHHARWTLVFAAVGLYWITARNDGELWQAIAVFSAIVLVTMILPRRRKVTRLRAKAQARRRSNVPNSHMCKLAAALPDPCFILDHRGIVRFFNHSGSQIFGSVKEGDPISFRVRQPDMLAALENVLDGGPIQKVQYALKNGGERQFEAWFTPIHLSSDKSDIIARPDFILLLLHDQTEQKNIERMRADFVANASHELRTPLASLIGFIETLQGPAREDPQAQERFLTIMQDQAERMSRLINDLLSLSRIEMRAHMLPRTRVDLNKIVAHVMDAMTPLARELDVTFEIAIKDEAHWVAGERDELVQIFENLIENALKYGKDGEKIQIELDQLIEPANSKPYYSVKVRDFGPGIPSEHVPRLTERFYRVDVASSREQKGTGLGLAIVKHILTKHHGRLLVDSIEGKGATFEVRLPALEIDSAKDL